LRGNSESLRPRIVKAHWSIKSYHKEIYLESGHRASSTPGWPRSVLIRKQFPQIGTGFHQPITHIRANLCEACFACTECWLLHSAAREDFWNAWGVHVSNSLLSESFNADYFVRHILQPIHSLQIVAVAHKQKKKFILHLDNSPIYRADVAKAKLSQMPIHLTPHPRMLPISLHRTSFSSDT
jgi:hypothetical protein